MTIEIIHPETQALIEQRMASGAFYDVEDVLLQALKAVSIPATSSPTRPNRKTLREVFEAVQGLADDVDFSRNPSTSRPVNL